MINNILGCKSFIISQLSDNSVSIVIKCIDNDTTSKVYNELKKAADNGEIMINFKVGQALNKN